MFYINKIIWFFLNPLTAVFALFFIGMFFYGRKRKLSIALMIAAVGFLWFQGTLSCATLLGYFLEKPYIQMQVAENSPVGDVIVLLGGGMTAVDGLAYPDMQDGADRVWHAARLYKARKASKIIISGNSERDCSLPLLLDFGVPREDILVDDISRNTYENSLFVSEMLKETDQKTILLVTSAWHMRRAVRNFQERKLKVIPSPADFKAYRSSYADEYVWAWFMPRISNMFLSHIFFKEYLGMLARK